MSINKQKYVMKSYNTIENSRDEQDYDNEFYNDYRTLPNK